MNRCYQLVPLLFLILWCRTWAPSAIADERPLNVLFIAIDDLNTRLNCYGHDHIHSPNIDRLAARGMRFDRAYCQYPSCGPSRASVLTGLRPERTGVLHNRIRLRDKVPNAVTLPQRFRAHGYHVVRIGKIYHQAVPTHIGTSGPDDPLSWDQVINPRGRDKDEEHLLTDYTPFLPLPDRMCYLAADGSDAEQTDGKVADAAIDMLKQNRDRPFFIAAGFYRPHIPYIAPKRYFKQYDIASTRLPKIPAGYQESVPAAALACTPVWPNFGTTERQARECILAYDACVSFVDAQVGRLLDALDRFNLTQRTLVVLWGDHGYHLGEHGLWRKNSLFEESARAPLIIAMPGMNPISHDCERIVEFVDIYPTIMDLAKLPIPQGLDGVSLKPLLKHPATAWNRPAYTQVQFGKDDIPGRAVRTDRWRYVEWNHGRAGRELYDQQTDPHEQSNLIDDPKHAGTAATLSRLLKKGFE